MMNNMSKIWGQHIQINISKIYISSKYLKNINNEHLNLFKETRRQLFWIAN
jgi:hypothetical protein